MSRPRRRGGGRRRHPAARPDRHHHPGQPPGDAVPAGLGRQRARGLADATPSSPRSADKTPEGRSIVVLAKEEVQHPRPGHALAPLARASIPFSAKYPDRQASTSTAPRSARRCRCRRHRPARNSCRRRRSCVSSRSICEQDPPRKAARRSPSRRTASSSAFIHLKDIVKGGIRDRFATFRRKMGIHCTVMITGDNPLTRRGDRRRIDRCRRISWRRPRPRPSSS